MSHFDAEQTQLRQHVPSTNAANGGLRTLVHAVFWYDDILPKRSIGFTTIYILGSTF